MDKKHTEKSPPQKTIKLFLVFKRRLVYGVPIVKTIIPSWYARTALMNENEMYAVKM